MEKADNEILKKTLRHYIDLEYYANGVAEDLDELLEALYKNCDNAILASDYLKTKADYNAVHSAMEDYFSDFQTELNDRLEKEAETVKENERDFLSMLYGAALTVGAIATSRVLFAPFDGRDTVKTFAERSVKNIRRTYDTAVRSGYMFGQSSEDVREQAGRNLKQITRWINNGITTAIPSFAKTTDRIVFLNNDVEVVWVATLDGRTCLPAGEQVLTPNGKTDIEKLNVGDFVIGGSRVPRRILNTMSKETDELVEIELENGKFIRCTPDHLILTERGWIEAGILEVTDVIKESL